MREIVADYRQHVAGEREIADFDRKVGDGIKTYRNVPLVYLREVTEADYVEQHPTSPHIGPGYYFWEVSVD